MDYYIHKDLGFLLDKFKDNNYRNFYDFKLYKNNIPTKSHWLSKCSENFAKYIIKQVLQGILFLNNNNYVHLNISLDHVLINEKFEMKMTDYKKVQKMNSDNINLFKNHGKIEFAAPDFFKKYNFGDIKHVCKLDIYSIGVMTYRLLLGSYPVEIKEYKNYLKNQNEINEKTKIDIIKPISVNRQSVEIEPNSVSRDSVKPIPVSQEYIESSEKDKKFEILANQLDKLDIDSIKGLNSEAKTFIKST